MHYFTIKTANPKMCLHKEDAFIEKQIPNMYSFNNNEAKKMNSIREPNDCNREL